MKSRILSRRGFFKGIAIVEGSSLLGVEPPLLDGLDSAGAPKRKGNGWARVQSITNKPRIRNRSPSRIPPPLINTVGRQFLPIVLSRENGRLWEGLI